MARSRMPTEKINRDPILVELVAIKKLLVLALMKSGASQRQIASALGVNQSQVSRLFPGGLQAGKEVHD